MDYSTLVADRDTVGSIKYWINYDRLDPVSALLRAQNAIFRKLRVREMHKATSITLLIDTNTVALPTNFRDPVSMNLAELGEIYYVPPTDIIAESLIDPVNGVFVGAPTTYTIVNDLFQFDRKADKEYAGMVEYYGDPGLLSGTQETNFLTDKYSDILQSFCIAFASEAKKDFSERDKHMAYGFDQIKEANKEGDLIYRSVRVG